MVGKNSINLIEEFALNQKNNDYILLTSFCFDPTFFDNFLLRKIRTNNPFAEIIVLIDAGQYVNSVERFTDQTGRTYQLIPIYLDNGFFHPKLFTFISRHEQKITTYVASSNITLAGFTRNAELVYKCEAKTDDIDVNFEAVKQFFEKIILNGFIRDEKSIQVFHKAFETLVPGKINGNKVKLLHNLDSPVLDQVFHEINPESISECFLFAPFFSPNTELLESICERITLKKIRIGIQKNNHNLTNPDAYLSFCKERGIACEIVEAKYADENSRIFHAKVLHFKGISDYLLIGSPNLTQSALMMIANQGNIEFAVLLNENNVDAITEQFVLSKLENPSQLPSSMEPYKNDCSPQLRIYSVKYDDLSKKIDIITEPMPENAILKISFSDEKTCSSQIVSLHTGILSISVIKEGIPTEIEITCNIKSGLRRIYYDRGNFFRNISRSKSSITDISNRLCQDSLVDNSEVQIILYGILERCRINSEQNHISQSTEGKKQKNVSHHLIASKISHSNLRSSITFLDEINSILQKIRQQEHIQNKLTPEESEEFEREVTRIEFKPHHQHDAEKKITKFINNIQDLFVRDLFLANPNPSNNEMVHTQAAFFNIILREAINFIGSSHIDQIEDILNQYLGKIKRDEDTKESAINLFKIMLVLNYFHDCNYHSKILGSTVSYIDFLEPNVYSDVKDFVINFHDKYSIDDSEFDLKKFRYYFCSLLTFCFKSSTIGKGPLEVIQAMLKTDDNELIDFYGNILLTLKSGPWDYSRSIFSLDSPIKEIKRSYDDYTFQNDAVRTYVLKFIN